MIVHTLGFDVYLIFLCILSIYTIVECVFSLGRLRFEFGVLLLLFRRRFHQIELPKYFHIFALRCILWSRSFFSGLYRLLDWSHFCYMKNQMKSFYFNLFVHTKWNFNLNTRLNNEIDCFFRRISTVWFLRLSTGMSYIWPGFFSTNLECNFHL